MKDSLSVTLVQCSLSWENAEENRQNIESLIRSREEQSDLIILPEMFTTGFSMNAKELAEEMEGESHQWMQRIAKLRDSMLLGSLIIHDSGNYYNRLLAVSPSGATEYYDKKHLFSFAAEDKNYSAGSDRLIVNYKGWRICPMICYDLRFPIWSRNADLTGEVDSDVYDLLVYVANWPMARRKPWANLLEARAHENQSYVIGINRVGVDGNGIEYSGDSAAYSPKGECMSSIHANQTEIETIQLESSALQTFREKFPVGKDKDRFKILP